MLKNLSVVYNLHRKATGDNLILMHRL